MTKFIRRGSTVITHQLTQTQTQTQTHIFSHTRPARPFSVNLLPRISQQYGKNWFSPKSSLLSTSLSSDSLSPCLFSHLFSLFSPPPPPHFATTVALGL